MTHFECLLGIDTKKAAIKSSGYGGQLPESCSEDLYALAKPLLPSWGSSRMAWRQTKQSQAQYTMT